MRKFIALGRKKILSKFPRFFVCSLLPIQPIILQNNDNGNRFFFLSDDEDKNEIELESLTLSEGNMNYPKNIAYTKMDRFKLSKRTKQKNVIIVVLMYGVFYDGFCEKLSIFFWFPINISSSSLSADIFDQK